MKYQITVKPGSSQEKVVEVDGSANTNTNVDTGGTINLDGQLTVYLRAKPHDGEANAALIKLLAKYFKIPKTSLCITRGTHSRVKIVEF